MEQGCYCFRIHQPLIFRRHHRVKKPIITLIKNYHTKIVVLSQGKVRESSNSGGICDFLILKRKTLLQFKNSDLFSNHSRDKF